MPTSKSPSPSPSSKFAPPSPAHERGFFGDSPISSTPDLGSKEYFKQFKIKMESLITQDEKDGATKDKKLKNVYKLINTEIAVLNAASMQKEGKGSSAEIQEAAKNIRQRMNQIVQEIMEDRWLRDLKNECEAIIAEGQEKGKAPEVIKKEVTNIINNRLKGLKKSLKTEKDGTLSKEAKEKIKKLSPVIKAMIQPLLPQKQKSITDQWLESLENKVKNIKLNLKANEESTKTINETINDHVHKQIEGLKEFMRNNDTESDYIAKEIDKLLPKIEELLNRQRPTGEPQEENKRNNLCGLTSPNNSPSTYPPPSPSSPPTLPQRKSHRP